MFLIPAPLAGVAVGVATTLEEVMTELVEVISVLVGETMMVEYTETTDSTLEDVATIGFEVDAVLPPTVVLSTFTVTYAVCELVFVDVDSTEF